MLGQIVGAGFLEDEVERFVVDGPERRAGKIARKSTAIACHGINF